MTDYTPQFTITNAITHDLTEIERARGFLEAATLSDDWIRRMSQRALFLEAHHTTHIEGTQLTLAQSEKLWAGQDVPGAAKDDIRELLNYRDAFQLVSDYLSSGDPITESLIREIHRRLVAIRHLLKAPALTIRKLEELCPKVSRRTLQRDLHSLEERGLIEQSGDTNQLNYLLRIDL